jgi:pyruvate ferredoxin oxidoreductase alpha subunit
MADVRLITGGHAVAEAMRQIDPDVVPVYPITPQTPIVEGYAAFVAAGRAHGELLDVESEHSALSAAVGAALAGGRAMTATSSQGLALMTEIVYIAASLRAPVVMAVGNRALSGPINIHCDHSDSMLARDSGVIQLFAENAQEAYDLMLIAPRLAEHAEVLLPVLVCQDGFTITHSAEPVILLPDEAVREFVGDYRVPAPLLDVAHPTTQGPFAMPDYYFELRHQLNVAQERAVGVFAELADEFATLSGRAYAALEPYALADAEQAVVCLGSTAGTAKDAIDGLRSEGERVGLAQIRSFRPFPAHGLADALAHLGRAVVLDRADSPGAHPPLYAEVAAALYGSDVELRSAVYGLGGREIHPSDIATLLLPAAAASYPGLRGVPCPG